MPTTKAQQRAVNKYIKNQYDRINLTLKKGQKAVIQAAAEEAGQSINGYVTQAVQERMERDGGK